MTILTAFAEVLLPVLVVVLVGYALRRSFPLDLASLNRVSLYALSPALIFTTLVRTRVDGEEALRLVLMAVLFCLAIGLLTLVGALPFRLDRAGTAALLLCTMFMNTGNFGLPISRFAFGEAGLQRALVFFIPQSVMAQVLAVLIAQMAGGDDRPAWRRVLRMPQIYAVLGGLLLRASGLNLAERTDALGSLFQGAALLSDATLPFLLMLLGMQLAQGIAIEDRHLTALAVGLRLLVAPLLAYALGSALGLDGLSLRVGILQASMPTAVNMVLYSLEFGARPRFVAGVVVASTIASLVTLTVLVGLMR